MMSTTQFYAFIHMLSDSHSWYIIAVTVRGSVRNTRGLGPTMTVQGHSIGISTGMLLQTLIMSRLDQILTWRMNLVF